MTYRLVRVRSHWMREWDCCNHLWQLLLSNRYPERFQWRPTCSNCGETGNVT